MLLAALIVFAIGAAIGAVLLAPRVLRHKFAPWPASILHALFGASGIVLLLLLILGGNATRVTVGALILFAVAACGGFFLVSLHVRKQLPPRVIVVVHALIAVAGLLTLLSVLCQDLW